MRNTDQVPFEFGDPNQFVENPEQRAPCVLLLDTSSSMSGHKINQLNAGLHTLTRQVSADSLALSRVEITIAEFGRAVQSVHPFATVDNIRVPQLVAGGSTPMGAALDLGMKLISDRIKDFRKAGVPSLVPFMFLISDGAPTDDWKGAASRIADLEKKGKLFFFPIGVDGADLKMMSSISGRQALMLKDANFPKLFQWVGYVMSDYSASRPGDKVVLRAPDWAEVRVP